MPFIHWNQPMYICKLIIIWIEFLRFRVKLIGSRLLYPDDTLHLQLAADSGERESGGADNLGTYLSYSIS